MSSDPSPEDFNDPRDFASVEGRQPNDHKNSSDLEGWVVEVENRRAESVLAAVRSFALSRQFLTEGKLSESERLIRFYEGVAMSLQRHPTDSAFREVERSFQGVLRYDSTTSDLPGMLTTLNLGTLESSLLRVQARYNLAVVCHRRWLSVRAQPHTDVASDVDALDDDRQVGPDPGISWKGIQSLYNSTKDTYLGVVGTFYSSRQAFTQTMSILPSSSKGTALERGWRSLPHRCLAVYLAASLGLIGLMVRGGESANSVVLSQTLGGFLSETRVFAKMTKDLEESIGGQRESRI
jgi:hypothetical protein